MFQYIICVGSRKDNTTPTPFVDACFNTSYVSVQAIAQVIELVKVMAFQYIICVGSSWKAPP